MLSATMPKKNASSLFAAFLCALMLSGCATPQRSGAENGSNKYASGEIDADPIEPLNRAIFEFNRTVDGVILKPVAQVYEGAMPERGQIMVSNFVDNLGEPVTFANSILQADGNNSMRTLWRFLINSSAGIGGLFDAASEIGLKNRATGLGDTFAVYGADAGPYIVLPILGPSNVRDALGRLGNFYTDPVSYTDNGVFYSIVGVKTIDGRHRSMKVLDDVYNKSIDPYATMRSGYTQYRNAEIKKAIKAHEKALCTAHNDKGDK